MTAVMPSTHRKSAAKLGWQPTETFESGLAKTVRWYLDNDWWWKPIRELRRANEPCCPYRKQEDDAMVQLVRGAVG